MKKTYDRLVVFAVAVSAVGVLWFGFTHFAGGYQSSVDANPIEVSFVLSDVNAPHNRHGAVRVTGLSSSELNDLRRGALTDDDWRGLLRVTVIGLDGPPMAGKYEVTPDALVFRPAFPLDPGRRYGARFDPARLPRPRRDEIVEKTISITAPTAGPSTRVAGVWPQADMWPENLLRFYVHFSAPMSQGSAVGRVRIEDDRGQEVEGALLPLEVDLWNQDRTRVTIFFDPGRVKLGILPNRQKGRPLVRGRQYSVVVDGDWRDAAGQPLVGAFRHQFTAGPEVTSAVVPSTWTIAPPRAGTRDALVVDFPWPLDRAILRRALGVAASGASAHLGGDVEVDVGDRRWRFIPQTSWAAGAYDLVVFTFLEDPSGNAVGRPFEIDMFTKAPSTTTDTVRVPFEVRGS